MDKENFITRLRNLAKNKGGAYLLWAIAANIGWRLGYLSRYLRPRRTFLFQGVSYTHFWHLHNATWKNERAIEIPIFRKWMERSQGKPILEVGNVLSHYFPANHEIVDKYEKGDGIVNEDIVDFRPGKKYDLIISISTLEHIGWDEEIKEPEKIPRALAHMQELLAPGGTLAVSMPLGYNPHLDELLESGDFPLGKRFYFKKPSRLIWLEASWEEVCGAKWDEPFEGANGLVFATWEKPRQ